MPYQKNKPEAGDQLSVSQADLQGNFQALDTYLKVEHYEIGTASAGKHIFTAGAAPAAPVLSKIGIFASDAITAGTAELYINRNTGVIPFTASTKAVTPGWTQLPSGIILKWGKSDTGGDGLRTAPLVSGAGIPTIATLLSAQVTAKGPGSGDTGNMYYLNFDEVGHTVTAWYYKSGPGSHNAFFYYLLIGY